MRAILTSRDARKEKQIKEAWPLCSSVDDAQRKNNKKEWKNFPYVLGVGVAKKTEPSMPNFFASHPTTVLRVAVFDVYLQSDEFAAVSCELATIRQPHKRSMIGIAKDLEDPGKVPRVSAF